MSERKNDIATAADWRLASRNSRRSRAEELVLPSGATILAVRPDPLEWILAGRLPQRLLAAALDHAQSFSADGGSGHPHSPGSSHPRDPNLCHPRESGDPESQSMTREEVIELAQFATHLVCASVVRPAIGDGPDEIPLDDIPVEDRAFIFAWACHALGGTGVPPVPAHGQDGHATCGVKEDASSPSVDGLERFCAQ